MSIYDVLMIDSFLCVLYLKHFQCFNLKYFDNYFGPFVLDLMSKDYCFLQQINLKVNYNRTLKQKIINCVNKRKQIRETLKVFFVLISINFICFILFITNYESDIFKKLKMFFYFFSESFAASDLITVATNSLSIGNTFPSTSQENIRLSFLRKNFYWMFCVENKCKLHY